MAPIVILGAGGFGREVLDVIEAINLVERKWSFAGFLDDGDPDEELLAQRKAKHLGPIDVLANLDVEYVIGIGSSEARARIDSVIAATGLNAAILVHPSATVGSEDVIGAGTIVCAHASITTHVTMGRHVQVNPGCTIGHDAVLEDFVTVLPGAAISGNVVLRKGATVGARAVVLQGLEIGEGATLGAGAVVTESVRNGSTVVGVPARPLHSGKR